MRSLSTLVKTGIPGPEGSASKLVWSENNQRLTKLALEILGSHAQLRLAQWRRVADGYWQYQQLRSRGNTIEAGTSEILRNIIAERVLGLPQRVGAVDFTFTPEQEDLRREARAFLEANPSASMEQLRELGWVGILQSDGLLVRRRGRPLRGARPCALRRAVRPQRGGRAGRRADVVDRDRRLRPAPGAGRPGAAPGHDGGGGAGNGGPDRRREPPARGAFARRLRAGARRVAAGAAASAGGARPRGGRHRRRRRWSSRSRTRGDRQQFGKRIGTYQAVSHSLVDRYIAVELARSLAYWAAWAVAEGDEQAELACAAAKSKAAEAAVAACERSIQVHGGIGFTWEHPLHRYYKRALWIESRSATAASTAPRWRNRFSARPSHRRLVGDRRGDRTLALLARVGGPRLGAQRG